MSKPIRVCVTGGAGQIGYALLPLIANGDMFGKDRQVIIHILEIEFARQSMEGVVMELQDGSYPLLAGVVATCDAREGFTDVDFAILAGAFPRKEGMTRKDLLTQNIAIFRVQGEAINQFASRDVKVLVVGNPANTNCLICRHFAPDIPARNFSALTRLDHNRTKGEIGHRLGINVDKIMNVIVWGNHSDTQFPDVSHGFIAPEGTSLVQAINDDNYLHHDFLTFIQKRGSVIINKRKYSSALSAAKAIVDHIRDWVYGTPEGQWVSMGVVSDGSYGIAEGLIYSYPVECRNGEYHIVQGLEISEFARSKMQITMNELMEEKETAYEVLGLKTK